MKRTSPSEPLVTISIHRGLLIAAGICGFTGVVGGTFGAHGLKKSLAPEMLTIYETGVHYHVAHAIALVGVAIVAGLLPHSRAARVAGWCMLVGIVIFCGSLYLLALTGRTWLGMITPIGGLSFLAGWASLMIAGIGISRSPRMTN